MGKPFWLKVLGLRQLLPIPLALSLQKPLDDG